MRVLVVTNMYPTQDRPWFGVFVEDQVESLRKLGIDVDVLMVDGSHSRMQYFLGFPRLWNQLLRNKYDLIHAHYVYAGLVAKGQWKYPVVLTHHGVETFLKFPGEGFLTSNQPALCRWVTPKFDEVIVVSEEMREKLDYPEAHVIPCGVDLERFKPLDKQGARAALGLPQDKKFVVWAGNQNRREKRFELVQETISILQAWDPSVELLLVDGKPHADVPMHMNAGDVLLLASDGEGSPMVVKEAMACNVPVVSVPVGDVHEVIGQTPGCYISSQEPQDMAEKIMLVFKDNSHTVGRDMIQHLSRDAVANQVVEVYRKALGQQSEMGTQELQQEHPQQRQTGIRQ